MFTPEQIEQLSAPLNRVNVKSRKQGSAQVSYIEGWHAESEANRIFGYGAWDSEVASERCVAENQRKIGQNGADGWSVSYVAKVRVTVHGPGGKKVVREGVGAGHGIDRDLGQAHESAIKEATTDAEKRALKTFGNPFGLALYDKTQANVVDAPRAVDLACQALRSCTTGAEFKETYEINIEGWKKVIPNEELSLLAACRAEMIEKFKPKEAA